MLQHTVSVDFSWIFAVMPELILIKARPNHANIRTAGDKPVEC